MGNASMDEVEKGDTEMIGKHTHYFFNLHHAVGFVSRVEHADHIDDYHKLLTLCYFDYLTNGGSISHEDGISIYIDANDYTILSNGPVAFQCELIIKEECPQ
jgi:hypothetical protein